MPLTFQVRSALSDCTPPSLAPPQSTWASILGTTKETPANRRPLTPAVTCVYRSLCFPADHKGVKEEAHTELGLLGEPPAPSVPAGLPALPHPLPAHGLLLHHVESHHRHHPPPLDPELQAGPGHPAILLLLGDDLHVRQLRPEPHPVQHVAAQERMEEDFLLLPFPREGSHFYRHVSQTK